MEVPSAQLFTEVHQLLDRAYRLSSRLHHDPSYDHSLSPNLAELQATLIAANELLRDCREIQPPAMHLFSDMTTIFAANEPTND